MTVTTLTTVGYGQIQPLDEAGRVVAMGAAVTGAVAALRRRGHHGGGGAGRDRQRTQGAEEDAGADRGPLGPLHRVRLRSGRERRSRGSCAGSGRDVVVVDILPDSVERARGGRVPGGRRGCHDRGHPPGGRAPAGRRTRGHHRRGRLQRLRGPLGADAFNPTLFIVGPCQPARGRGTPRSVPAPTGSSRPTRWPGIASRSSPCGRP